MEIVKDTILMKDPKNLAFENFNIDTNPFAVGIILALPLKATSLQMLSTLISISKTETLPSLVRVGSLAKFFRHFSDIQRYVDVVEEKEFVFSLFTSSCEMMNLVMDLADVSEIQNFLLKSFKQSVERLTFEFRTKLEVLNLVNCTMKYKIFNDFPSNIYKIPIKVIENALRYESLSYLTLYSTVEDVWRIIKSYKTLDFDPIKNISYFLVSDLINKTESFSMTQTCSLLLGYSGQLNKSQEFKILYLYKQVCSNIGCKVDSKVCYKLGEVSKEQDEPSAWDFVDEEPIFMDVQIQETVQEATERVFEMLKGIHTREYLKYEVIEKEVLDISRNFKKDSQEICKSILRILEKEELSKLRFWKTFISAARKNRLFSYDEIKSISDMIYKLERGPASRPSATPQIELKPKLSKESLRQQILSKVDEGSPDRNHFDQIESELTQLESELKCEFPLIEVVLIGSLSYKLYLKNSPADILIQSNENPEEILNFQKNLELFITTLGDASNLGSFILLKRKDLLIHIYYTSKIPRVTSSLITRYVTQGQAINTFLIYLKIWSQSLPGSQASEGYFWTLLGLFYMCNSNPPVLRNLVPNVLHQIEPLDGFDVWIDPNEYECADCKVEDLFLGFLQFLNSNLNVLCNYETGDVEKDSEFVWGVVDFFYKGNVGIKNKGRELLIKAVKEVWESVER